MQKFNKLVALGASLPILNVDTDMIIPKQFLTTIKRTGLGANLFYEMRYDVNGSLIENFVLNQQPFSSAKILVSRDNFGCGSSREHAPWALLDFGIRCIIAPSFADIFFNNCFKNGILPIILSKPEVEELLAYAENKQNSFTIDLALQELVANNKVYHFNIDSFRKKCLLEGLDDIGLTLQQEHLITEFENNNRLTKPWLY
ncbi:MAG: 3-isopropylmalate dehydratase small subunit [Proteobacteria bacterium]|jgi:3-isopropylmalate/(R)-2-methylmalate dehydratase small subunit|nr:3-isopropylmalate dehydratase small subunit [Pseudomonadota bacterium]